MAVERTFAIIKPDAVKKKVAGQILALALATELGTFESGEILEELRELERLPDVMRQIEQCAQPDKML